MPPTKTQPQPTEVDPMVPRTFRLLQTREDTRDTFTLELEPTDGVPLKFKAGQFTMLHAFGVGEVPISISSSPVEEGPLIHTIRNVGGVTRSIVEAKPGTEFGVRGPFGTSWDVTDGAEGDLLIITGGIGLAPLRPAILEALAERDRYNRVILLYGARTPEDILFSDELRRWADRMGLTVEVTVDSGPPGWKGRVGFVTQLIPRAAFDAAHTWVLVCGPEVMMRATATELRNRGIPASH
ncbi:MAG: FAD/NAD(P)-binding protein, partial [Demequinaceae bacterium]|nr:FAD/NAD(P)-binding protein [Demequinaceae bacterium]